MILKPPFLRGLFDSIYCHVIKSQKELKIRRIEYIKDQHKNQMVILLECDIHLSSNIDAYIQRNYLVIEVHRSFDYIKPFRSNLINRESFNEYGEGGDDLGFSEVHLNHGFKYHLLSCQMIKANLIKVILSYQRITNQLENSYN